MFYFFCLRALTPLGRLVFPFHIKGAQNIPESGKLVVCCNHKSLIDPFLLAVPFRRPIRFMAKSELFEDHGPLARWLLYKLGAFPVRRGKGDAESIKTAIEILNENGAVGIFPQGKCVFGNEPFQPKAGAVLVAMKAHAPILPVSIYCDGILKPFRRITVRFGTVIPYETLAGGGESRAQLRTAAGLVAKRVNELLEKKGDAAK